MKATHKYTEGKTKRQIANMALKAMSAICDYNNGTIRNPVELASCQVRDGTGRTLIQAIYEDEYVRYNDGWHIVEVDDFSMYIDFTGYALAEMGNPQYEIDDEINKP